MKFTDELNTTSENEKTRSSQAIKQHIMENDFVESLVAAIMEACKKRAREYKHSPGFVLHRDCDSNMLHLPWRVLQRGKSTLCGRVLHW